MREDFPFLRAIFNQPDDDTLRLVYADWLQERGDPRAEYLRLDVEQRRSADGTALAKQRNELAPKLDGRWVDWMRQAAEPAHGSPVGPGPCG